MCTASGTTDLQLPVLPLTPPLTPPASPDHLETHLVHPHTWVRLVSAQLFGLLFAAWTPEEVVAPPGDDQRDDASYFEDPQSKVWEWEITFTSQLHKLCIY